MHGFQFSFGAEIYLLIVFPHLFEAFLHTAGMWSAKVCTDVAKMTWFSENSNLQQRDQKDAMIFKISSWGFKSENESFILTFVVTNKIKQDFRQFRKCWKWEYMKIWEWYQSGIQRNVHS